eukprot:scaffold27764_cov55-Phaeocystis_antarctica.AAC.1
MHPLPGRPLLHMTSPHHLMHAHHTRRLRHSTSPPSTLVVLHDFVHMRAQTRLGQLASATNLSSL